MGNAGAENEEAAVEAGAVRLAGGAMGWREPAHPVNIVVAVIVPAANRANP
jgi:hypothetical protein